MISMAYLGFIHFSLLGEQDKVYASFSANKVILCLDSLAGGEPSYSEQYKANSNSDVFHLIDHLQSWPF